MLHNSYKILHDAIETIVGGKHRYEVAKNLHHLFFERKENLHHFAGAANKTSVFEKP